MLKRLFVFHHAHCMDGITAAAAFELLPKDKYEVHYNAVNYDKSYTEVITGQNYKNGDTIAFVDFAPSIAQLDALRLRLEDNDDDEYLDPDQIPVIVLDHHDTSAKALEYIQPLDNEIFFFDRSVSGAFLAYTYVRLLLDDAVVNLDYLQQYRQYPDDKPLSKTMTAEQRRFITVKNHVSDRDTWQFKLPDTHHYYHYLKHIATSVKWDVVEYFKAATSIDDETLISIGTILGEKYENDCQMVARRAGIYPNLTNRVYAIVNVPPDMASRVGEILYKEQNVPVVVMYYDDLRLGIRQYSFRSQGNWDVGSLAQALGGGGHKNASGVRIEHTTSGLNVAIPNARIRESFHHALVTLLVNVK